MHRSHQCRPLSFALLAAIGLLPALSSPVAAQEAAVNQPVAAPVPGDRMNAAATNPKLWDRLIYLPYKNLKTVFEKGEATVLMPYLEYLRMKERSSALKPDGPPVSAVITESHYAARVEKDLVRIRAELTVQVLDKPWASVPISFGDAAVGKVTSDKGNVLLRGTGKGSYSLLLPSKGKHRVELELAANVSTSPDGRSFRFNCPPVGITTFELIVPEADQSIEITPKRVALPVEDAAAADVGQGENEVLVAAAGNGGLPVQADVKQTQVRSSLGSTPTIAARWFPRTGLKPDMALLAGVENTLDVAIADGLVHTSATLRYKVLRGELQQLRIAAPLGHRILDVAAPNSKLKSWKAADEENRQLITVELLTPVRDAVTLEIHTERPLPEGAFDVAGITEEGSVNGIHAIDAVRENGLLALAHGGDVTLSIEDQQGLIRVDAAEVAAARRRTGSLYYKYYSPQFRLSVAAGPVEPRITAQQTTRLIFGDDELKLQSTLAMNVERAGVFELRVKLPEGLTVDTVAVDGLKEFAVDEETNTLTVALLEQREGALQLEITGHRDFDPQAAAEDRPLPLLEPLGVTRETGLVSVYAPPSVEVITEEQNVSGAYPEPTTAGEKRGTAAIVSAWSYSRRPVSIPFRTRRKPTHLTADVGTAVDVGQQVVKIATRLDYQVDFAGIDTFRFQVPAAVSEGLQIEAVGGAPGDPAIRQRLPADEAVDGWVTWSVVMQQEVTGRRSFRVTYDLKRDGERPDGAEDSAGTADARQLEPLRVLGLEAAAGRPAVVLSAVRGEIVVLKDRALAVAAEAAGGDVEPIDVRELQLPGLSGEAFLAWRYHKQPVSLKLTAEKHDIQQVVATIIPKALVEIVIGRDELATWRCRYRLISSERQRLAVDLPAEFEPLAVLIDGNPVTLEKNGGGTTEDRRERRFVNISRSKASGQPFYLTLIFRAPAGGGRFGSAFGGRQSLPLPRIGGDSTAAVAVQQLKTAVWIPREYALVGSPENFVARTRARLSRSLWGPLVGEEQTDSLEQWIGGGEGGSADFPTAGHAFQYASLSGADAIDVTFYRMSAFAWVLSIALLLVAVLLLKTSWENKLGFLLLTGFLAALFALGSADWVFHALLAARFGIAALLACWLLYALSSIRRAAPATPPPPQPSGPVIPPAGAFGRLAQKQQGAAGW